MMALGQFGAQQLAGAAILFGCVIWAVAMVLSRLDDRHR
jgi:hypothetical protein